MDKAQVPVEDSTGTHSSTQNISTKNSNLISKKNVLLISISCIFTVVFPAVASCASKGLAGILMTGSVFCENWECFNINKKENMEFLAVF